MPLFICGRSPVFPVKKAPELYFFQAADCAAAFVRTGILPLGTAERDYGAAACRYFSGAGAKGGGESESGDRCSLCTADYFRPGNRQKKGIDAAGSV